MTAIQMTGVSKVYPGEIIALHPTDLGIGSGELVTVVGPSGSGKSTLIRLIAGLETPTNGTITFDGDIVNDIGPPGRRVGLVVTQGALYDNMTAEGNFRFPLMATGIKEPEASERVASTAGRFGIRRLLDRRTRSLSAGERQLVAAGRATVRDSNVLLLDEAVAGVDLHRRRQVRDQIRNLHDGSLTIVYATNEQDEAMTLGNRIVVLDDGAVQQVGGPIDVYTNPVNTFVAQFLGSPGMNVVPALVTGPNTVRIGDDELEVGATTPQATEVMVGIRPERVRPAAPGRPFNRCLHARATRVEQLGSARLAHVAFGTPESGAVDFIVRVEGDRPLFAGDQVELEVDIEAIAYFDRETGVRL